MLPDERYVTVEDAAKQMHVQPITLQRWLAIGTMPQYAFEGTGYVLQADVDAFNEACLCRNQKVYTPNPAQPVASEATQPHTPGGSTSGVCYTRCDCSAPVTMSLPACNLVASALQHGRCNHAH